jgi:hypothetical protein
MSERIPVGGFDGELVAVEETTPMGRESRRQDVFYGGEYVGQIVYWPRRRGGVTHYGWQRAKAARNSRLLTKHDAIRDILSNRPVPVDAPIGLTKFMLMP